MMITLVGYRGTGKTTLARELAQRLGWTAVDADQLLVEKAGQSIAEIFQTRGEAAFRDLEAALLEDLVQRRQIVLATGGGVVIRPENRQLLQTLKPVIWLKASTSHILARLHGDETTRHSRPSLTSLPAAEEIRTLLAQREPWYAQVATFQIQTDDQTPAQLAEHILHALDFTGKPA